MPSTIRPTEVPIAPSDAGVLPLDEAVTYTMNPLVTSDGDTPVSYYEMRVFMLAAIEQARLDVVVGITDSSASGGQRPKRRADALMFFLDGRYEDRLQFCGVETKADPIGIPGWTEAIARWARNMPGCSPVAGDVDAVRWAYDGGHLDKRQVWEEAARAGGYVKKTARRLLVKHLDSGSDNLERVKREGAWVPAGS